MRDTVLVGTGNVASHLAEALAGRLLAIAGRNEEAAKEMASSLGVPAYCTIEKTTALNPAIIIVSVADHALPQVASLIGPAECNPLVLHTSGTVPKEVLSCVSNRTGVLYPLQTFSKGVFVDISKVPFFTEVSDENDFPTVDSIALSMSRSVHHANESQRRVLHVAGVFTSNFTNAVFDIVERLLATEDYPLSVVEPLAKATVDKAFSQGPFAAQTGPACRGDRDVIEKHAAMLDGTVQDIYRVMSRYIIETHNIKLR